MNKKDKLDKILKRMTREHDLLYEEKHIDDKNEKIVYIDVRIYRLLRIISKRIIEMERIKNVNTNTINNK